MQVKYSHNNTQCTLTQPNYIDKIIKNSKITRTKLSTPTLPGQIFTKTGEQVSTEETEWYRQRVGELRFLADCTRPDIDNAVMLHSRFQNAPTAQHCKSLRRVFRYVIGTRDLGIVFRKQDFLQMVGYADANYDARSTTGYVLFMGGPIAWRSALQRSVAQSTMEAEYMALAEVVKMLKYFTSLGEFFNHPVARPTILYEDNASCISLAENPVFPKRAKHIHVRYHMVRLALANNEFQLCWVPSLEMVADLLTKPVSATTMRALRGKLLGYVEL